MDQKELLEALAGLTARYEQHRSYIDKARAQLATGKFNSAVIERVVLDHEIKSTEVAELVSPLLPKLRTRVSELDADKASIHASKGDVDEQVQELELRNAIGELSDADFEKEAADLRATQGSANARIAAIDADLTSVHEALERWAATAGPGGHYAKGAAPVASAPAPVAAPAPTSEPEPVGSHGGRSAIVEELFDKPAAAVDVRLDDEIAIEASEAVDDSDASGVDVEFSLDAAVEVEVAAEPAPTPAPIPTPIPEPVVEPVTVEAPRRALLLLLEGTPEEQIYPFNGDLLTIGRGRPPVGDGAERHIQIKNDSKVSRIHCSLFRRGDKFYIEDGHTDETGTHKPSANNTFVNGEVVSERRLFGGEEIIVGETFFRFRIMD
jgi:hypothetical protein